MKREALESLMPLLTEMILDGIEVKIKPSASEYPDMEFYLRESDSYFFLHGHDDGEPYYSVSSIIEREQHGAVRCEHYFSALSLVMQGMCEARIRGGQ